MTGVIIAVIVLLICAGAAAGPIRAAFRSRAGTTAGPREPAPGKSRAPGRSRGSAAAAVTRDGDHGMLRRLLEHWLGIRETRATDWLEGRRAQRRHATVHGTPPPDPGPMPGTRPGAGDTPIRGRIVPRPGSDEPDGDGTPPPYRQDRPGPGTVPPQPPEPEPGGTEPSPDPTGGNVAGNSGATGAVEQVIEGTNRIDAHARAGNINAKHRAVQAFAEVFIRMASTLLTLSRWLTENSRYGPEIAEPVSKSSEYAKAAALSLGQANAAIASLKNMTVSELAESARQAPDRAEFTEAGGA